MKKYQKYGSCQQKHSINVIEKNLKSYFQEYASSKEEVQEFVEERLRDIKIDGQAACEWGGCKNSW
jgi:hypothetical protein